MARSLAALAREAILVQDACNLLGVSKSYAAMVQELSEALAAAKLPCHGQFLAQHGIHRLWVSKLHDMANLGTSDPVRYGLAYDECRLLTNNG